MEHVFWLEHYPRSISGIIEYLSNTERVYCICCKTNIYNSRERMGWGREQLSKVEFVYLDTLDIYTQKSFLSAFLKSHSCAIHYIMGLRYGNISVIVREYLLKKSIYNIFVISERPYMYGKTWAERFLLKKYYYYLGLKYRNRIKGVFAMGQSGVDAYQLWAKGNVFNFLYPRFNVVIKALYVGQLDRRKGVDLLLDCIDDFIGVLDLSIVGANGNIEKQTISRIERSSNVRYLGVWNSQDVCIKASTYDVCVVPSRYDGWGMFVMEAIEAGVGVITTDQTGSKDLVIASEAGMVVKANSSKELQIALKYIVNNPSVVDEWKLLACKYKERITKESVGRYFRQCIDFAMSTCDNYPMCPWF